MRQWRNATSCVTHGLLAASILFTASRARAQCEASSSTIATLRQILATPVFGKRELADRRRAVHDQLRALSKPSELRDALFLPEWRDADPDDAIANADRTLRAEVAYCLKRGLFDALRSNDPMVQLAAARMLGDWAVASNTVRRRDWHLREFGPLLAEFTQGSHPSVRETAVRVLGRIQPEPSVAGIAVGAMLRSDDVADRRAAAQALVTLVTTLAPSDGADHETLDNAAAELLIPTCRAMLPLASHGLADRDVHVRRDCVEAFRQTGLAAMRMLTHDKLNRSENFAARIAEIRTLAETINSRMIAFTVVLNDLDPSVRLSAHQALEIMTSVSQRLDQIGQAPLPSPIRETQTVSAQEAGNRPEMLPSIVTGTSVGLVDGFRVILPSLAGGMNDPEFVVRRASLDVLESLGNAARPESSTIVAALRDHDLHVRWSAARILGRLGPVDDESAVSSLAGLLRDIDMDVRVAAAGALQRYGSAAREAVPALIEAINHMDPGTRVAAMRALEHIGIEPALVTPALVAAMSAPEARVRHAAARFLGLLGPGARDGAVALRVALDDSDMSVRKAANDALLHIFPAPKQEPSLVVDTSAISQASYVEASAPFGRPIPFSVGKVIAATSGGPPKSSFATENDSTRMKTPAWRPSTQVGPAAAILPPNGAKRYSKVRAND